jgi:hypothetical protein
MAFELNHEALLGFRTRFESRFNDAYALAKPDYPYVALVMDSGLVEQVTHRWLNGLKYPQEFIKERTTHMPSTSGFTIVNREWEWTYGIKRKDIERDPRNVFGSLVPRGGELGEIFKDQLIFGLLQEALTTPSKHKAYDGVNFFGNHNIKRKFSFNNLGTEVLSVLNLQTVFAKLYAQARDTEGSPLIARATRPMVITGTALAPRLRQIKTQSMIAGTLLGTVTAPATTTPVAGVSNPLVGSFDDIENGVVWLDSTPNAWCVVLHDRLYMPCILQKETPLEFYAPPTHFMHDWTDNALYKIGSYERFGFGLALPEMVYASDGSGS